MSEARWVARWILLIYLTTTGIFLGIFFGIWYDKLRDELIVEKTRYMRDAHRTIVLSIVNARFVPLERSCANINATSNAKFALIDDKSVICSTLDYNLTNADIKGFDEQRYMGKFRGIHKNKVYYTSIMRSSGFFLGHGGQGFDEAFELHRGFKYGTNGAFINKPPKFRDFSNKNQSEFSGEFIPPPKFGGKFSENSDENLSAQPKFNAPPNAEFRGDFGAEFDEAPDLQGQGGFVYSFIEGEDVSEDLFFIRLKVLLGALASFALIGFVGYFLVRVALKPLESKITMLNSFIKDFTHEINTPLSVILLSIEQLEKQHKNLDTTKFARMKVAAKTLSQTYSDLIFLTFPDTIPDEQSEISFKSAVSERLEYFKLFFEQKKLNLSVNLRGDAKIFANKSKINKMLDNLISNAIKYNKKGGSIAVTLDDKALSIKDSGYGIDEKNLAKIFDRYARFNNDQGGFGIGLSLVKSICKDYGIEIRCYSTLGEGSEFVLKW